MQPPKCLSVSAVSERSTVCVAETICHPNQMTGKIHSHLEPGHLSLFAIAEPTPMRIKGTRNQMLHRGGQGSDHASESEIGAATFESRMTGFPNFNSVSPRNNPNKSGKIQPSTIPHSGVGWWMVDGGRWIFSALGF